MTCCHSAEVGEETANSNALGGRVMHDKPREASLRSHALHQSFTEHAARRGHNRVG